MNRATKFAGLIVLMIATGVLSIAAFLINRSSGFVIPVLVALVGLQTIVAFWGLGWALPRSNTAFFSIFLGDALFKMAGLMLAVWWLWTQGLPYTGPLLTLGGTYMLFSFIQIPFFYQAY